MTKIIAKNKKAYFDYEILESYEAGLALNGPEIKSIRASNVNLKGSYLIAKEGELWVKGMHISPFKFATFAQDPLRERKLLLHKRQINKIIGQLSESGISTIPLEVYLNKKGLAKMKIGIGKGKKKYDKRQSLKRQDEKRRIEAKIKQY
jgi:SsrA-binding protein